MALTRAHLDLCRPGLTAADFERIYAALTEPPPAGLEPLIWRQAQRLGSPRAADARLTAAYHRCLARALRLAHLRARTLDVLDRVGVSAVVLKGADAAERIYPDPGCRPMQDLDLLLPRAALRRAVAALRTGGFRLLGTMAEHRRALRLGDELALGPPEGGDLAIELHWRAAYHPLMRRGLDAAALGRRARRVRLGEREALVLAPADWLLYHLLHLGKHYVFPQPYWFADVIWWQTREGRGLDVVAWAERARRAGVARVLERVLARGAPLWGPLEPLDELRARLRALRPHAWRRRLEDWSLDHPHGPRRLVLDLLAADGLPQAWARLRRSLQGDGRPRALSLQRYRRALCELGGLAAR